MGKLRTLLRLPPTDRRLLLRATLLVTATRLVLACLPFRVVRTWLIPSSPSAPATHPPSYTVERIGWAVHAAGRRIVKAKPCLAEALVAHRLLLKNHYPSEFKIGVMKNDKGHLEAHAWVECEGRVVVGDGQLSRFTPLGTLAGDAS